MPDLPLRHTFLIEAHPAHDALIRVLTPFAVQQVAIVETLLTSASERVSIRIEVEGLEGRRAETLLRRLRGLPVVQRVGLGWREAAQAA